MVRGKYLSLEEARKAGKLDQFAWKHPTRGDGDSHLTTRDTMIRVHPPTAAANGCFA